MQVTLFGAFPEGILEKRSVGIVGKSAVETAAKVIEQLHLYEFPSPPQTSFLEWLRGSKPGDVRELYKNTSYQTEVRMVSK